MKNKVRRREPHNYFYIGSLKYELHQVYQDNMSITMHYIKRITQFHKDYTFQLNKNTNILESHKNLNRCKTSKIPLTNLEPHQERPKSARITKTWWFSLANQNMSINASKPSKNLLQDSKIFTHKLHTL